MSKIGHIAWLKFRLLLKQPGMIWLMFVMPLFFSVVFGFFNGGLGGEEESRIEKILVINNYLIISSPYLI
jgi:hypothetical protein